MSYPILPPEPKPFQFRLRTALMLILGLASVLAVARWLVIWSHQLALDEANRRSVKNLEAIGTALALYNRICNTLPAAYDPSNCSWRVRIADYLPDGYPNRCGYDFRMPWNSTRNLDAAKKLIAFHSPADGSGLQMASYLAVIGPLTAWSNTTQRSLADIKMPSRTILIIEVHESGIEWTEPSDIILRQVVDDGALLNSGEFPISRLRGQTRFLPTAMLNSYLIVLT